jgi:large subunit ribosomal protein L4
MATIDLRRQDGSVARQIELADAVFGIQPNVPVMHQVVTAQLAAARSGTQSTLTRAEVRGGGRKPWKQKGTGRARQGSTRAPHWVGGGVALGPKPRDYSQKTPKKMVRLALLSALSDRASESKVAVVEAWDFPTPRTKDAKAAIAALGLEGKVLLVLDRDDEGAYRSFRNLPGVQILMAGELNAYDVLCNDWVVFTEQTLPTGAPKVTGSTETDEEEGK